MDYSTMSKSELWSLVKAAKVSGITWQSTKVQMIEALHKVDTHRGNTELSDGSGGDTVATVNLENKDANTLWDDVFNEVFTEPLETVQLVPTINDVTNNPSNINQQVKPVIDELVTKETQTNYFSWSYKDHELSGGWKVVKNEKDIEDIVALIDALNATLPNERKILVHGKTVSIKMKPGKVIKEAVNGAKLVQVEKQPQKNNDYANRKRTKLSTNESPGKHNGETSVKSSILFKAAQLIPARYFVNGVANIDGIDTISVNNRQVYPYSISAAIEETKPLQALVAIPDKILKRRKEIAQKKVQTRSLSNIRGKIHNGFSPVFEDSKGKLYCLQIDNMNRILLWSLPGSANYIVSSNDLVSGRMMQDLGYIEKVEFTHEVWHNLTLDLIKGGLEARLERFNWLAEQVNKAVDVTAYLTNFKDAKGNGIQNLKITDTLISGQLYGSELLLGKRKRVKTSIVLHPNARATQAYIDVATTWIMSLGNQYQTQNTLKVNNVTSKIRVSDTSNHQHKKAIRTKDDLKYLVKMLKKFTSEGIYADRDKTIKLGKLVLTDGSDLSDKNIEDIAKAVLNSFPIDRKLATLFTPTHAINSDEWLTSFLKLIKVYAGSEVAILHNGSLTMWNTGNEVLHDWCKRVYRYFKEYGVTDNVLKVFTIGDAISKLQQSPNTVLRDILVNVPDSVELNKSLLLADVIGLNKIEVKTFKADPSKLSKQYESLVYDIRSNNGLED